MLVAQEEKVTLSVPQPEAVVEMLGLPEALREDELHAVLERDLEGEALLEEQRVAVEDTLRLGLALAHKVLEAVTLALTLEL